MTHAFRTCFAILSACLLSIVLSHTIPIFNNTIVFHARYANTEIEDEKDGVELQAICRYIYVNKCHPLCCNDISMLPRISTLVEVFKIRRRVWTFNFNEKKIIIYKQMHFKWNDSCSTDFKSAHWNRSPWQIKQDNMMRMNVRCLNVQWI